MRQFLVLTLLLWLGGCAHDLSMTASDGRPAGEGVLRLTWVEPHDLEVRIGGKRYVGPWSTEHCTQESCGEAYQRATPNHKRHFRKGQATLVAEDGDRLVCEWVSHLPEVKGVCHSSAGQRYSLSEAPGQSE